MMGQTYELLTVPQVMPLLRVHLLQICFVVLINSNDILRPEDIRTIDASLLEGVSYEW